MRSRRTPAPFAAALIVLLGCACTPARASARDGISAALDAARAGNLAECRRVARAAAAGGRDAAALHVLGVVELALLNAPAAEKAFSAEIEIVPAPADALSGLEDLDQPGSALYESLRKLKPAVSLGVGRASALNNRAAARYLQGNLALAMEDADAAAVTQANWGAPWINAALILLDLNQTARAEASARRAIQLGEQSAHAHTALAEVELKLGSLDRARDSLDEALSKDPNNPYALLAHARLLRALGRDRESQRSFVQAIGTGPVVAADSRLEPAAGDGHGFGGSATEAHIRLFSHGLPSERFGYRLLVQSDRERVEGRDTAYQQSDWLEGAMSGQLGAFSVLHQNSSGGRPGAVRAIVGIAPSPLARYTFEQTNASWQIERSMGARTSLAAHLGYRSSRAGLRETPGATGTVPLRDEQWTAETRIDLGAAANRDTSLGIAVARTNRRSDGVSPVEPLEQVLPPGVTTQITGYAIHRRPIAANLDLVAGGVVTGTSEGQRLQPVVQLAFKVTASRAVRLSLTPRVADATAALMPLDIIAASPQEDRVARTTATTSGLNGDPTLQQPTTQISNLELAFGPAEEVAGALRTTLFHRRIRDASTQSADARVATRLQLTPLSSGEATGVEGRVRFDLARRLALRLWGAYQETNGVIGAPTYRMGDYPAQNPAAVGGIPNFPRLQGSVSLDWTMGGWSAGLEVHHVGGRPQAVTVITGGGPVTYVARAPAATGLNVRARRRAGRQLSMTLGIFNLARSNFYVGYPGATTAVFGYEYRY